jgi:CRISPR/Cas system CMR subunit Cmr6 (Cas7 group RAMP superfamily)
VSQSNENLVTQIDLQNLKKELSTELKNELVNEIRKNYEEIAKLSKTPQNLLTNSQFVLLFLFFVSTDSSILSNLLFKSTM